MAQGGHISALRSVTYNNISNTPDTSNRTVKVQVNDGSRNSLQQTATISVTAHNDAPVVTTTGGSDSYTENDAPVTVDGAMAGGVTVSDPDSATLAGATVKITTNYQNGQDVLALPPQASGITATYAVGTGTLTLSKSGSPATVSEYETALRSVTFEAQGENPATSTRTIVFQVDDGSATNNLSDTTNSKKMVTVTAVNDPPTLTQPDGALSYVEDSPTAKHADPVAPNATLGDPDTVVLSVTVKIATNYQIGEDVLSFTNNGQVSGAFTAADGTMTLTATSAGSAGSTTSRPRSGTSSTRTRATTPTPRAGRSSSTLTTANQPTTPPTPLPAPST